MTRIGDALAQTPEVKAALTAAKGARLDGRTLSKGFAQIDKALISAGAFHGLTVTAFRAYLYLLALCYEKPNARMRQQGLGPRDCKCGYADLAWNVPGRKRGQGATRGALIGAVGQLERSGLVTVLRKGTGPEKPNVYHLRNWVEWRAWKTADGRSLERLIPSDRDTADRKASRRNPEAPAPRLSGPAFEAHKLRLVAELRKHAEAKAKT